jgi:hypothetical protein
MTFKGHPKGLWDKGHPKGLWDKVGTRGGQKAVLKKFNSVGVILNL